MLQEMIAKIVFTFILLLILAITYYIMITTRNNQQEDKKYNPLLWLIPLAVAVPLQLVGNVFISSYYLRKNTRNP